MVNLSLKDLLTKSCMQLKYLREHPEKKRTPSSLMYEGCRYQHQIAAVQPNLIGEEMGCCFETDDIRIYFSNDIICSDRIIEVKQINGHYEDYYLENSLLQCAVYKAFILACNGNLATSKFHVQNGNDYKSYKIAFNHKYYLFFGNRVFSISVITPSALVNFIVNKANASLSYETAKEFDYEFKHKEFEMLSKYFTFKEV